MFAMNYPCYAVIHASTVRVFNAMVMALAVYSSCESKHFEDFIKMDGISFVIKICPHTYD